MSTKERIHVGVVNEGAFKHCHDVVMLKIGWIEEMDGGIFSLTTACRIDEVYEAVGVG